MAPPLRDAGARLVDGARSRLSIDARSLAAFRIALGGLLLADLLLRARDLTAFYTDAGVLPRAVHISRFVRPETASIHFAAGTAWFQAGLFALAGAVALALLVGYRTRVATVASWVLLVSLHNRIPVVLNGGDVLFRMLLFWAMFLPLGERWSVDGLRSEGRRDEVVSVATVALLLQVVIVYAFNAAFKLSGDLWLGGEAMVYVFSLDQFTVLLGDLLAQYRPLLYALGHLWLALLVLSPLLVLLTGWPRAALVAAFAGMHLGMLLTMQLGLFPLIVIAGLLAFLPGAVWDALLPRLARYRPARAVGRVPARLDRILPERSAPAVPPWVDRARGYASAVVPAFFLVLVVLWNVQTLGVGYGVPDRAEPAVHATQIDQRWSLFAPDPLSTDGWYVAPAYLVNGSQVDAYYRQEVRWDRPPDIADTYPNMRWRKYLTNLWRTGYGGHRPHFAEYLCQRWNRRHDTNMINVTLYYMEQPSQPFNETEPVERNRLYHHQCGTT